MKTIDVESRKLKMVINIVVIVISFWGASRKDMKIHEASAFESFMIDHFAAPLQRSMTFVHGNFSDFFENYIINVNASKENSGLKTHIDELKRDLFDSDELKRENLRLKALLDFGREINRKKILARIVAWDASTDFKVIRVNGVRLQSTVVTANGLVGYVYRLTDHFSDILTILDSNNRVDAIVGRTRSHGIIEGHLGGRCFMKYVNRTDPVQLGDRVLTSGLGNVYPKGIQIGVIGRIERESFGITQGVEIIPSVELGKLEEVVILAVSDDQVHKAKEWKALDEHIGEK